MKYLDDMISSETRLLFLIFPGSFYDQKELKEEVKKFSTTIESDIKLLVMRSGDKEKYNYNIPSYFDVLVIYYNKKEVKRYYGLDRIKYVFDKIVRELK